MSTERTRQIATRFAEAISMGHREAIDRLLHEDAEWWVLGRGFLDRSAFMAVQVPDRPQPVSARRTITGVTVDGERAALEVDVEIEWPDGVYRNRCHHLIVVRDDRIIAFREYLDPQASRGFFRSDLPVAPGIGLPSA